jgi:fumarate reductase subunit D
MTSSTARPRNAAYRRDAVWLAAFVHRVSGLLLACFLPLHFLVLGLAIEGEARLDQYLKFGEQPLIKLAEATLIFILTIHLFGGLRILAIEFGKWKPGQRRLIIISLFASLGLGLLFFVRVA